MKDHLQNSTAVAIVQATPRLTVTVQAAEDISGLGKTTLYAKMESGDLAYTHVGVRRLIYLESLKRLLGLCGDQLLPPHGDDRHLPSRPEVPVRRRGRPPKARKLAEV